MRKVAQNADSPLHRTVGRHFIVWNEVERRQIVTKVNYLLETGELFLHGIAEEPHALDVEAEATDTKPEAHVMEPLADDYSSDDGEDPSGKRCSKARSHESA